MCASPFSSTTNSRRRGLWVQARGWSIRWKAFWFVATSSFHRGGASAGLASRCSSETSSKGGGTGASGRWRKPFFGRVGGGNTDGVVGRDRESGAYDELSPDGAGWGCLQATRGTSEVGGSFVVKALPAVTTRGGSAWQTSKGVLPTGARASKQRAGSVDGVGRKAGSRGSKARITDRRTKADEAKTLVQPPAVLVTRITLD